MGEESGFHPAGCKVGDTQAVISPQFDGQSGPTVDGRRISGSGLAAVDAAGDIVSDSEVEDVARASIDEDPVPLGAAVEAVDEARAPRLPHNPGRPTKR